MPLVNELSSSFELIHNEMTPKIDLTFAGKKCQYHHSSEIWMSENGNIHKNATSWFAAFFPKRLNYAASQRSSHFNQGVLFLLLNLTNSSTLNLVDMSEPKRLKLTTSEEPSTVQAPHTLNPGARHRIELEL
jgi:hypothetical protein